MRLRLAAILFLSAVVTLSARPAAAELLCQVSKTKVLKVIGAAKCPKGSKLILNTATFKGTDGTNGADGKLAIYGDGSVGPLAITSGTDWTNNPPAGNIYEFTDFTVSSGQTLFVASGTVIRCTGTFTVNGTITVVPYDLGSTIDSFTGGVIDYAGGGNSPGVAARAAYTGEVGDNSAGRQGGRGGAGMTHASAATILRPSVHGGGAGAGNITLFGGAGGGTLTVLAKGGIVISSGASITANGNDGAAGTGAGAGGILVLASPASITNAGLLSVAGGKGGNSTTSAGIGGGGGGGIINLVSPSITVGTTSVAGGTAGTASGNVTSATRQGGRGGGACAGAGGTGGALSSGGSVFPNLGADGSVGVVNQIPADPTDMF
jgi:hypothetical protein